jgi:hypothetical protein
MGKSSAAHRVKATQDRIFAETGELASTDELSEGCTLPENP